MPIRRRTCRPASWRSTPSSSSARSTASGPSRVDGFFEGPFATALAARRDPHRDPPARPRATMPGPPTSRSSSRPRATPSSASPRSSCPTAGRSGSPAPNVALTGVGDHAYRARPSRPRSPARTDRRRPSPPPPPMPPTASRSRATSMPTVPIGPRWPPSTPAARSRPPSPAALIDPAERACRSSASPRAGARPRASRGRS